MMKSDGMLMLAVGEGHRRGPSLIRVTRGDLYKKDIVEDLLFVDF